MRLLSEAYRQEQKTLHAKGNYGTASKSFGKVVSSLIDQTGAKTLLDYGCGSKRSLLEVLAPSHDVRYEGYDPAVEDYAGEPDAADLVVCIDVLEHIEPELLDNVLDHIASKSQQWFFASVHTGAALKTLSDGRNAHLIQEPPSWWLPKFFSRWDVQTFQANQSGFTLLCRFRPTQN